MSNKYPYEVRSTGRPFGPCEKMDDDDFTTLSRHTTYTAAVRALNAARADDRRVCGQNAWSDHFRVFYVGNEPITLTFTHDEWDDEDPFQLVATHQITVPWCPGESHYTAETRFEEKRWDND